MGYWHISVRGVGAHHNKDYPKDANIMAKQFVEDLKAAGHIVDSADFTYGSREDLPNTYTKPVTETPVA